MEQIGDLRTLARVLGGIVSAGQVLAPGPNHGPLDRSLAVWIATGTRDGFTVHSHAGDDPITCKDYVRQRLGLAPWRPERRDRAEPIAPKTPAPRPEAAPRDDPPDRPPPFAETWAGQLWSEGVDPRRTLAERYLVKTRGLDLGDDLALSVIRWHAGIGAMLSLFRNIHDVRRQAVLRTFLNPDATRGDRKFTGPTKGAAIMLDDFHGVSAGLHIAEGLETGVAARLLDMRPCWAVGSRGQIATFPVLGGIQSLTICAERDDKSPAAAAASERDVRACADRWHAAGRDVFIDLPTIGKDVADAVKWRAAQ